MEIRRVALAMEPGGIGEHRLRFGRPFQGADRQQGVARPFDGIRGPGDPDDVRCPRVAEQELRTVGVVLRPEVESLGIERRRRSECAQGI